MSSNVTDLCSLHSNYESISVGGSVPPFLSFTPHQKSVTDSTNFPGQQQRRRSESGRRWWRDAKAAEKSERGLAQLRSVRQMGEHGAARRQ